MPSCGILIMNASWTCDNVRNKGTGTAGLPPPSSVVERQIDLGIFVTVLRQESWRRFHFPALASKSSALVNHEFFSLDDLNHFPQN